MGMNAPAPILFPRALTPELRQKIERAVERLLAVLDGADILTEDLEPSLAAPENHPGFSRVGAIADQLQWGSSGLTDSEVSEGDDEPSFGWTRGINQAGPKWHGTAVAKSERECPVLDGEQGDDTGIADALSINPDDEDTSDRESDNADSEWSLGWTIDCSRGETGATWKGLDGDREQNGDEGDCSFAEDDNLWPESSARGSARQGRQEARAMLATVPEIIPVSPLVILGPDGNSYQIEPIGKGHRP